MKWVIWAISRCNLANKLLPTEKQLSEGEQATFKDYGGLASLSEYNAGSRR
jgi:hypothetical protein